MSLRGTKTEHREALEQSVEEGFRHLRLARALQEERRCHAAGKELFKALFRAGEAWEEVAWAEKIYSTSRAQSLKTAVQKACDDYLEGCIGEDR